MNKTIVLRVLCAAVVFVTIVWEPVPVLAQRGGHAGGGGFHRGGGGFHGGGGGYHASRYYGSRGDEVLREAAPPADSWLAEVCVAWEREAFAAEKLGVRVAAIRTGLALHPSGGALKQMLPPFRWGVGGRRNRC